MKSTLIYAKPITGVIIEFDNVEAAQLKDAIDCALGNLPASKVLLPGYRCILGKLYSELNVCPRT